MAVFKCKMCGGTIEFEQGATVGVCDSCGTKQTLPKSNDEIIENLFARANNLRLKCEFDKAEAIYEKIVELDNTESEAHWGIILCKYGIEYVEDPKTFKRIPTCHRTLLEAVLCDADYLAALENADASQRELYEREASLIDSIQKDILSIVRKEKPFDVFICYKETDENGNRTQDSVIANDIYYQLTQEGFKVFYAAITLEDKLGREYEPYIFAALNSAKVMLVIGTKPQYFDAVWVHNEWSRFLKLMKTDRNRLLIPCYRDMDAYELPEEFAHLQAQNTAKIGFINDLVRGIKKVTSKEESHTTVKETVVVSNTSSGANVTPILERAFLFLEDGKWNDADIYCEKVLDINPKNAEAYLGKLMVELQVKTRKQLADCAEPFDDRDNYGKVLRFGDEALENEMRGYIAHINDRNENTRLTGIYENAQSAMQSAQSEDAYKKAANLFITVPGFKDADALAKECIDKAEVCRKKKEQLFPAVAKAFTEKLNDETAKNTLKTRIESLKATRSSLGLFAGKQKKQLDSEIAEAEQAISECDKNISSLQKKLQGYTSKQQAESRLAELRESIRNMEEAIEKARENGAYSLTYEEAVKTVADEKIKGEFLARYPEFSGCILFARVGDRIRFGNYYMQNNTSKEPIEWRVLAKEDNRILVISEYALDCQKYNTTKTSVMWDTCSLRTWLNGTFYDTAFGTTQKAMIQKTTVSGDLNLDYCTISGSATSDNVFLLSITEVNKYFSSDEARKCIPTAYAIAQGAYTDSSVTAGGKATCWWRLRSSGKYQNSTAGVRSDGLVNSYGSPADIGSGCVRPAMWISLE